MEITVPPKHPSSPDRPLLTPADLGPLDAKFLHNARSMLPLSTEDEAVQLAQHEAVARLLQKTTHNILLNEQKGSDEVVPILDEQDDQIRQRVQDPVFVALLVGNLVSAREALENVASRPRRGFLSRIWGVEQNLAQQVEAQQQRQAREAQLAEVRSKAFESTSPEIGFNDLQIGDKLVINTIQPTKARSISRAKKFELSATYLGPESGFDGAPALLEIEQEVRNYGINCQVDAPKQPGIIARLRGSVKGNDYMSRFASVRQGEILQFVTTEGTSVRHGATNDCDLVIDQIAINGIQMFPRRHWKPSDLGSGRMHRSVV